MTPADAHAPAADERPARWIRATHADTERQRTEEPTTTTTETTTPEEATR